MKIHPCIYPLTITIAVAVSAQDLCENNKRHCVEVCSPSSPTINTCNSETFIFICECPAATVGKLHLFPIQIEQCKTEVLQCKGDCKEDFTDINQVESCNTVCDKDYACGTEDSTEDILFFEVKDDDGPAATTTTTTTTTTATAATTTTPIVDLTIPVTTSPVQVVTTTSSETAPATETWNSETIVKITSDTNIETVAATISETSPVATATATATIEVTGGGGTDMNYVVPLSSGAFALQSLHSYIFLYILSVLILFK